MSEHTKEEFVERWENHVNDLARIGFNLSEKEDRDQLEDLQDEVMELVEKAALERAKEEYEEETFRNGRAEFTISEVGINRYGHMPGDEGDFYITREYSDGYVNHCTLARFEEKLEEEATEKVGGDE